MPGLLSGRSANIPYSLSRWTDVPGAKWDWMKQQLKQGWMVAFDPRSPLPGRWSLAPQDTLGLMFWTKDPRNLVADADLLRDYRVKIHATVTGWEEVEKGAPGILQASHNLVEVAKRFGPENVVWRFSPVPIVPDAAARFRIIAEAAGSAGIGSVFVSFLQPNDLMPETRSAAERVGLLREFAEVADLYKIRVNLCNDDTVLLAGPSQVHSNLGLGVCAPVEDFSTTEGPVDTCGCGFAVDPFTVNESCTFGCQYCYAADTSSASKKRNTTRHLPVLG